MSGTSLGGSAPILGISLTIAALFQMVVYAFVVLYSLYWGAIDLVIPVKSAFLAVIFVVVVRAVSDTTIAWKNRRYDPSRFTAGIFYLVSEATVATGSFLVAFLFLSQPLSNIDLTHQSFEVRGLTSIGVLLLLVFTGSQVSDLIRLRFGQRRTFANGR